MCQVLQEIEARIREEFDQERAKDQAEIARLKKLLEDNGIPVEENKE